MKILNEEWKKRKRLYIGVMIENRITDLSDSEIERVFKDCVAPALCKKGVKRLMKWGHLSMREIKKVQKDINNIIESSNKDDLFDRLLEIVDEDEAHEIYMEEYPEEFF